jgi:hypothetical protein
MVLSQKCTLKAHSAEEILKIDLGSPKFCDMIIGKLAGVGIEVKDGDRPKSQRGEPLSSVQFPHEE